MALGICTYIQTILQQKNQRGKIAVIARELTNYNIDIAALTKTCLTIESQLTEIEGGCTFGGSSHDNDESHDA